MTIIVYHNGIMAADGGAFRGGMVMPSAFPKIVRAKCGALAGVSGRVVDCWAYSKWFSETEDVLAAHPKLIGTGDDEAQILFVDRDGQPWIGWGNEPFYPSASPAIIGIDSGCVFVRGAIAAGADVVAAVNLVVQQSVWACAPVQIERLNT
jgi:hypothetical protein